MGGIDLHNKLNQMCKISTKGLKWTHKIWGFVVSTSLQNSLILYNTITRGNLNILIKASQRERQVSLVKDPPCPANMCVNSTSFSRCLIMESMEHLYVDLCAIANEHKKKNRQMKLWQDMSEEEKEGKNEIDHWTYWLEDIKLTRDKLPYTYNSAQQEKDAVAKKNAKKQYKIHTRKTFN